MPRSPFDKNSRPSTGHDFIVGGGEMGELIRAMDWTGTPPGRPPCGFGSQPAGVHRGDPFHHRIQPGAGRDGTAPRRTREAGFDHHLVKPVDFNRLQMLLASLGVRMKQRKPLGRQAEDWPHTSLAVRARKWNTINRCVALMLLWLSMPVVCAAAVFADIPPLPPSLVVDRTGTFSAAERDALAQRLKALQVSGRGQIAILVSSGIGSEALAAYSLRVAEAWRLGRAGRDDGLLVLVIPSTNAARIEVGYGLEGDIPDARASQWLDELIPAMRRHALAAGLDRLVDEIEGALPDETVSMEPEPKSGTELLEAHPEWVLPFFLLLASPMTLFPMFLRRRGHLISGPLLALDLGLATWTVWDTSLALAVAGGVLPLPWLWSLNGLAMDGAKVSLPPWKVYARNFGNVIATAALFAGCTLLVGFFLPNEVVYKWIAVLIAAIFAITLASFLFPGKPALYLSNGLPGLMFFTFLAFLAYFALQPLLVEPTASALAVAGIFTALLALTLSLDSAERRRAAAGERGGIPWSVVLCCLSLLAVVPFALLALVRAATGDDWHQQLIDATSGGGALAGMVWFAARVGLHSALKVGLGGLFGGGGAGRG